MLKLKTLLQELRKSQKQFFRISICQSSKTISANLALNNLLQKF